MVLYYRCKVKEVHRKGEEREKEMLKKINVKKANEINKKNGMDTWEDDGEKTYWVANEEETVAYGPFFSQKERNNFLKG